MSLNTTDTALLSDIRRQTQATLRNVLGDSPKEVILLDTPRHRNLGDSLIWRGTLDYLHGLGHKLIHQSDWGRHRDEDLRKFPGDAVVLLQGGGNFGDLYPLHDEFRRHVITTFPQRRIVVLPQTVHYTNEATAAAAIGQYRRGENLSVLLREQASIEFAEKALTGMDVRFCYDLALGAQIDKEETPGGDGVLVLARNDGEQAASSGVDYHAWQDWTFRPLNQAAYKSAIGVGALYKRAPTWLQSRMYESSQRANSAILHLNIDAAVTQFMRKDAVATDRLHAHVLSLLLGIPHAVTDNSYGKISSIYKDYTGQFSSVRWADDLNEAVEIAGDLARAAIESGERR